MKRVQVANQRTGDELGGQILVADRWWLRLRGMLARPRPQRGDGLFLTPCRAVHMYGMSYPLDVVFLSQQMSVVAVYPALAPGQRSRVHREAYSALELPAGTLQRTNLRVGDVLTVSASLADGSISSPPNALRGGQTRGHASEAL